MSDDPTKAQTDPDQGTSGIPQGQSGSYQGKPDPTTKPPKKEVAAANAGLSAEELQIQLEVGAAAGKGLKEDAGAIEKAEKEAADALAAYLAARPTLKIDEAVEAFRTQQWKCIQEDPGAKKVEVDKAIKEVDDAITGERANVKKYASEVAAASTTVQQANQERDEAWAAFETAAGYLKQVMDWLKMAKENAAKSIKESGLHPATSYMFGTFAITAANNAQALKTVDDLKKDIEEKLQGLLNKTESARTARQKLEEATVRWMHAKKRLLDLTSARETEIAKKVAFLDAQSPTPTPAPVPIPTPKT